MASWKYFFLDHNKKSQPVYFKRVAFFIKFLADILGFEIRISCFLRLSRLHNGLIYCLNSPSIKLITSALLYSTLPLKTFFLYLGLILIYMKKNALLFCLVFVLFSCSQKDESISTADNQDVVVDTNSKVITRFIPASKRDIEQISQGVKKGISLCDCYKSKSLDFNDVYAVACKVKGGEIAVGVWAMGTNGGIFSVGYPTATISDWGNNPQRVSLEDDGFQEILDYVREIPSSCGD